MTYKDLGARDWHETRPRNMPARTLIRVLPDTDDGRPDFLRVHVGQVMSPFFSTSGTTPPGWMDAVGQLLSCEHYPDLFAVIGYAWGNAPTIEVAKPLTFAQRVAKLLGLQITEPELIKIPNPDHKPGFFRLPDCRGHIHTFN